jgi:predicted HTH domain antitoxin
MCQITIEIPEETLIAMRVARGDAASELRMAAAVKLFELGRMSSGAAAKLAGVPRVVFLSKLADYGVDTFRLAEDDLKAEAQLG